MSESRLYLGPIYVKKSPVHGYGVFAGEDLAENTLIEECHAVGYSNEEDPLNHYSFVWGKQVAIAFGYACIYNHSNTPNLTFAADLDRGLITFTTLRAVRKGEELFTSYGKHWFGDRQLKVKSNNWFRKTYHQISGRWVRAALVVSALLALTYWLRHFAF